MPRPRKPASPFRYFHSSPEVIRLVVMMYGRYCQTNQDLVSSGRENAKWARKQANFRRSLEGRKTNKRCSLGYWIRLEPDWEMGAPLL